MQVRLTQDWTDGQGVTHPAGATITVDEMTGASLVTGGIGVSVQAPATKDPRTQGWDHPS
ncbi:hypothetical protein [Longispora albida]|uniref:hypothetical protein n=1 Tax=Longispora albida TaxID=203523 RepID=UPI0003A9B4DF|nr:hypothetical protein [Longispora albida]